MPATHRVILQAEAFKDLDAIIDYIKQHSPRNAASMVDRLWEACQSLDQLPYRYKVHRSSRRPDRVVYSMPVPPYIVYYRVVRRPPTVRILTIRHGARLPPRRFK